MAQLAKVKKTGGYVLCGIFLVIILSLILLIFAADAPALAIPQMSRVSLDLGENNGTAVYGQSVVFTAEVENKAELTGAFLYKWYKNGGLVQTGTKDSLLLSNVEQSGKYYCHIIYSLDGVDINTFDTEAADAVISPFELDIIWSCETVYYCGTPTAPQATAYGPKDESVSIVTTGNGTNASEDSAYEAQATVNNANYTINPSTATCAYGIAPRETEVVWAADELIYNGSFIAPAAHALSADGKPMAVAVSGGGIRASETVYEATATIDNPNYTLTNTSKSFLIVPKTVSVYFSVPENMSDDGDTHTVTAYATGLVEGDTAGLTVEGDTASLAGVYTATVTAIDNSDYKLPESGLTVEYTVFAKSLTIPAIKEYPEVKVVFDNPVSPLNQIKIGKFYPDSSTIAPPANRYFIEYYNLYMKDGRGMLVSEGGGFTVTMDVPKAIANLPKVSIVANTDGAPKHIILDVKDGKITFKMASLGSVLFLNASESDYTEEQPAATGLPVWAWALIGVGGGLVLTVGILVAVVIIKSKRKKITK